MAEVEMVSGNETMIESKTCGCDIINENPDSSESDCNTAESEKSELPKDAEDAEPCSNIKEEVDNDNAETAESADAAEISETAEKIETAEAEIVENNEGRNANAETAIVEDGVILSDAITAENVEVGPALHITERPYQTECLETIEEAGAGHHLIAIATGLGKTVIFTHIKRNGRVLILSHRDELVHQPQKYYDCSFGVEKAEEHSNGEEVVSASVQTLNNSKRLHRFKPDDFDTIIVDECFPAGTLVDGRRIETLRAGDVVTAYDHDTGECVRKEATYIFKRLLPDKLMLINGSLACTWNHPIYIVGSGYTPAKEIAVGDIMICRKKDGTTGSVPVADVIELHKGIDPLYDKFAGDGFVYNLEVAGLNNYFANGILVHNCHHAAAPSYRKILNYFSGARRVLGFTATPKRGDKVRLTDVFDDIIYSKDLKWGIENNYLCRIRSFRVYADYDLSQVRIVAGDYNQEDLEKVLSKGRAIPIAARAYMDYCHSQGKHTLIYCASKSICASLLTAIRKMMPKKERDKIQIVLGDTPAEERKMILDDFQGGKIECIINCMVLTEGTDLPIADCIMNLRPTCNLSLYQQIVGRGTRLYDGKDDCLVIDVMPKNGDERNLCSAPTLFGIDPSVLDKETKKKIEQGEDLLELCEAIGNSMQEVAKTLHLQIEALNLFLSQHEQMMRESSDIMDFAHKYIDQRSRKESDEEWNFYDMDVEIMPDEQRYYRIKPTWEDVIYIAKPDMLDKTTIEIDVKDASKYGFAGKQAFIKEDIAMKDAIDLAHAYCEMQPDQYQYSWNKEVQQSWMDKPMTDAQKFRLMKDYSAQLDMCNLNALNKITASRLIDLQSEIKEKTKMVTILQRQEDKENKNNAMSQLTDDINEKKQQKEINAKNFSRIEEAIEKHAEMEKLEEETGQLVTNQKNGDSFEACLNYKYFPRQDHPISESQESFLASLQKQLMKKKIYFPELENKQVSAQQATLLIDILSSMNSYAHRQKTKTEVNGFTDLFHVISEGLQPARVRLQCTCAN